jgi:tRNA (cmo5U34)-methyltransferase
MAQFHFHPETYLELMESEMPGYHRLQDAAAVAAGTGARRILELGTGTGETTRRVLARHPDAELVGIDASARMLARAREALPNADLRVGRLEDPLPEGPFDLVVSVLAVHHLDRSGKADLFRRVAAALKPGGTFVLADVVVPQDPADATTPLEPGFDLPSPVPDQLAWLRDADLEPTVTWHEGDLAVIAATRESVRLEPLSERHLAGVEALLADPGVLRFTRVPEPPPAGFARRWIARYEDGRRDGSCEGFAAVDPDGRFLGLGLVPEIEREAAELELGYIVAPGARGRGVATAILRRLTRWAFEALGAQRIVLIINVENTASERVAERCGYVREGVMRSIHLKQDIRTDAALWSRLPTDP